MLIKLVCSWLGGRSIERRATSNSVNNEAKEDLWREVFCRGLNETGCVSVQFTSTALLLLAFCSLLSLATVGISLGFIHFYNLTNVCALCPLLQYLSCTASSQTQHPPSPKRQRCGA
jgi:hypothetical protein